MNIQHYDPRFRTSSHVVHVATDDTGFAAGEPLCGATKHGFAEWRSVGLKATCQLCIKRDKNASLARKVPALRKTDIGVLPKLNP